VYAKANPGKLTYGPSANRGPLHIGAELFKRAGVRFHPDDLT
jgi:hypothetical protein